MGFCITLLGTVFWLLDFLALMTAQTTIMATCNCLSSTDDSAFLLSSIIVFLIQYVGSFKVLQGIGPKY